MFHYRTNAKAFDHNGRHTGPGDWLDLIRTANGIELLFGSPESYGNEGTDYVETYPDARVVHRNHEDPASVSVVATTERGDRVLTAALAAMKGES